jgi:primosomal protein N' (replication factor Y)
MPDALASTLFIDDTPAPASEGPFAGVAIEKSIDRVLDYAIPKKLLPTIAIGQQVKVPLGRKNRLVRGYIVSISPTTDHRGGRSKIKELASIEDPRVLVDERLMRLARWISRYYICALGTVIETIVPAAVKKRIGIGYSQQVRLAQSSEQTQEKLEKIKTAKRRAILARLLQLEPEASIEIGRLATEAGVTPATVRKLARLGLITIKSEVDLPRLTANPNRIAEALQPDLPLSEEQAAVYEQLLPQVVAGAEKGEFSVHLLHGVTGSGKTEVYLHAIRQVLERGKQAIVLVPEIALTPQALSRFTARFARVAVLHSGLSATERHRQWQRIALGEADVVVGARSAIFAPLPKLGVIVVDEEHENSYKADTAPRYHARDVAIKRGQLEGVAVILGSATPSLETYARARGMDGTAARVNYLSLPNRVRGLAMPHVELVDMRNEARLRRGMHLISLRLEALLRHTLDSGKQAILLLNRRGYSNFVFCSSCQEPIKCKYCDTTMTYHRSASVEGYAPPSPPANAASPKTAEGATHIGQMHCHYCLAVNALPTRCPACQHKLSLFGLGTQRVEEELARKFPDLPFARVDSDTMRQARDYERLLQRFSRGEIKVMLGTQMIAKGLDYPSVTLVGVISGDTALSLPDFRSAERTFQLITQVAGRAGRGDSPGRVVLQTFVPDDPTIRAALNHDYDGFASFELKARKELSYPPYSRMVRIILRDQDLDKLNALGDQLAGALRTAIGELPVLMRGPMPCAISRIAGYCRAQVLLNCSKASILQSVLAQVRAAGALGKTDRIAVDVDPVSLL